TLEPVAATPGSYEADFIPSRPGVYRFVFSGRIEDTPINEAWESGPKSFDEVLPTSALQFPPDPNAAVDTKLESAQAATDAALDLSKESQDRAGLVILLHLRRSSSAV